MAEDVTGVFVEERRRPKGRGQGLASLRTAKDSDTKGIPSFMLIFNQGRLP